MTIREHGWTVDIVDSYDRDVILQDAPMPVLPRPDDLIELDERTLVVLQVIHVVDTRTYRVVTGERV